MDVKSAFRAMAASKPVKFWYCAKDVKGKPCFLFDATAVPQLAIDKVLSTAKDKKPATGVMRMEDRALTVVTKGSREQPPQGGADRRPRQQGQAQIGQGQRASPHHREELGEAYRGENKKAVGARPRPSARKASRKRTSRCASGRRRKCATATRRRPSISAQGAAERRGQVRPGRRHGARRQRAEEPQGVRHRSQDGKTYVFDDTSTKRARRRWRRTIPRRSPAARWRGPGISTPTARATSSSSTIRAATTSRAPR